MAQDSVEKFLGRLITDDDFREFAKNFFSKACIEYGYTLTPAEQKILQSINFDSFIYLSNSIDRGIKRCGGNNR
ncbi:MAG: hypothetical protein HY279_10645 [Nitrospinae bacterium]|nr:hypothetical protein [Nitrospinota bacterium]